jgi:hypothetical protein
MPAPVDPGDFQSAPQGTPVAPPYEATAASVNARFAPLYAALTAADTGLDADSILDGTITPGLVAPVTTETVALSGATWSPANLTYYWVPAPFYLVLFKPLRYTASVDFSNGATFGTMPVNRRPDFLSYFACARIPAAGGFGSMGFSIDSDGTMKAEQNFGPASQGIGFVNVEYRAAP